MQNTDEYAVVVGATGELGSAIVERLHQRGLHIIAVARSARSLEAHAARYADRFTPCIADIASDNAIDAIGQAIGGTVRMVVHGPGVPVAGGVRRVETQALASAVNIKVGGMLRLVRACEPHLQRQSRLVAIGGHYGFEPSPYAATAGVANAALANLVRQLSWAYGAEGITAHLVAPGPADTSRMNKVLEDRAASNNSSIEQERMAVAAESAIGSMTSPEQIGWAVAMLLDPEADALAGSPLFLDSGRRRGLP